MTHRSTDADQPKSSGGRGESALLCLAAVSAGLIPVLLEAEQISKINPSSLASFCLEVEALTTVHHKWPLYQQRQRESSFPLPLLGSTAMFILAVLEAFLITQKAIGYSYHNEHVLFWKYIKAELSHQFLFSNNN